MKFSFAAMAEPVRAKMERKRMLAVLRIGSDVLLVSKVDYRRLEKETYTDQLHSYLCPCLS